MYKCEEMPAARMLNRRPLSDLINFTIFVTSKRFANVSATVSHPFVPRRKISHWVKHVLLIRKGTARLNVMKTVKIFSAVSGIGSNDNEHREF